MESLSKSRAAVIFFSRLEFVPAQINGQKNTIAARDRGLWVGCTAVLLYCLLYRDPRSMPPNRVRTSSQRSTPAHLVWLFFSLCPWRLKSSLTEDGRGALAPARPEPLNVSTYTYLGTNKRAHTSLTYICGT